MNICGEVECSDKSEGNTPAVCKGGSTTIGAVKGFHLNDFGNTITINYGTSSLFARLVVHEIRLYLTNVAGDFVADSTVETSINLICDTSVTFGQPTFKEASHDAYDFELRTSLACPPSVVDCIVRTDDGSEFDLSSLRDPNKDWKVKNLQPKPITNSQ